MKIALGQINPTVGDFSGNAVKMIDFAQRAQAAGAGLILFPELSVCGYPPRDLVEKPKQQDAPSLYAAAGRYVLDRAIFDALQRIQRGVGGEMQLTDAIALLIKEGHPVHVVVHRGSRHDLGNPGGYLKAAVDFALDRDDYGPDLRRWLVTRLGLAEG